MMVTLTRKERERLEREARILELARGMFRESGYLGLSMDRIAAQMEYSKGTIYQHFPNKEEIILALANEALEKRLEMFGKAAQWEGHSRERMAAIGAAAAEFVRLHPMYFAVDHLVRSNSIWEKTTDQRRQIMQKCEANCMQVVGGVVRDAVDKGDLQLSPSTKIETIVFGLWAMNFGAYAIITSSETLDQVGLPDPEAALWQNLNRLLDGYHWRPLSSEFDYFEVFQRAKQLLFGKENPGSES